MTTRLSDASVAAELVGDAVTAPSMHNAQPWRFVFRTGTGVLELHGDPQRAMPRSDPAHRALHIGCAAALFNLRVAAARRGLGARVELLPDAADPWLLAAVALDDTAVGGYEPAGLYDALRRRHTSRHPFTDEPVPPALLDGYAAAARLEGCHLKVPGSWHLDTVLELVRDAEHHEEADPLVRAETAAWARGTDPGHDDGVPAAAYGPRSTGGPTPVRDFGRARPLADRGWAVFEKDPQLALLSTAADTRSDWLRAGQALQRVLLQATADGLATSMTSQPLEWPELRRTARDPVKGTGHVQMVLRLGYGPPGAPTPRRAVADVLEVR